MAENELVLLQRFVKGGDAEAFSEIVQRHAPIVYGACLRVLEDQSRAADVVQETFLQLLRDAGKITGSVPSWLHRVATRKALDAVRADARRRKREARYAADKPLKTTRWEDVSVHVDQGLDELDDETRRILIQRFFQGRTTTDIAADSGVSQPTVSRRVESGVAELREILRKRGIIVAAAALGSLLTQNAVQAAPAIVMKELGKMALIGTTAATASTAAGGTTAATASTAAGVGTGVLATVKAKIIVAATVAVVGVGSVATYNQITKPTEPPASKTSYSRPDATAVRRETERTAPVRVLREEYRAQTPAESLPPLVDNTDFDEQAYDSYDQPTDEAEEEIVGGGYGGGMMGGKMGGGMGGSYGAASAPQNDQKEANDPAETPRYRRGRSRRE